MDIIRDEIAAEDPYLRTVRRHYRDRAGTERVWSYVERTGDRRAVVIVPSLVRTESLLLLRQFRVPLAAPVLEFPAGLIDDGESPEAAALRELREETGFDGVVRSVSPALSSSAGVTTEQIHLAFVDIHDDTSTSRTDSAGASSWATVAPGSPTVAPPSPTVAPGPPTVAPGPLHSHEDSEEIQVLTVPFSEVDAFFESERRSGTVLDAKLYLYWALLRVQLDRR